MNASYKEFSRVNGFIKNLGRENVFFKEKGKVFKKNLAKVGNVQQDLEGKGIL